MSYVNRDCGFFHPKQDFKKNKIASANNQNSNRLPADNNKKIKKASANINNLEKYSSS